MGHNKVSICYFASYGPVPSYTPWSVVAERTRRARGVLALSRLGIALCAWVRVRVRVRVRGRGRGSGRVRVRVEGRSVPWPRERGRAQVTLCLG